MKDSRSAQLRIPFVWPFLSDNPECDQENPRTLIEHVFGEAGGVAGIVSDIEDAGVAWLKDLLSSPERKARIVLAVYAGCPTRSKHLTCLLNLQGKVSARAQFRILPMMGGLGAPSNCLTVVPRDDGNPIFLFSATPNFGFPEHDQTQCNVAFRAEPALIDRWRRWFDRAWAKAAVLTDSTARIPSLVPARGSAEAAAHWREYCKLCSPTEDEEQVKQEGEAKQQDKVRQEDETQSETSAGAGDQDAEDSTQTSASKKPADQSPSESVGLHKLDPLADRVISIFGKGKQVSVAHGGAVGPLDVPISARFFDQEPEQWEGTVVRRQRFRISAFSKEELRTIEKYRKASRTLVNKLSLPFEKGLHWMPHKMIPILEEELAAVEKESRADLIRLIGPYANTFVKGKRMDIERDLGRMYCELGGQGDLPRGKLMEVLDRLERKIQDALGPGIISPVTFYHFTPDLQRTAAHEEPWTPIETFILELARFPRRIISKRNTLSGLSSDRLRILDAMNVEDDSILRALKDNSNEAIRFANWELARLEQIADSDTERREKCKLYLRIIGG